MLPQLALADRDVLFSDWGVPALLLSVHQSYDAASGLREGQLLDTPVRVVPGHVTANQSRATGAEHHEAEATFLIRQDDVPDSTTWAFTRLSCGNEQYRIVGTVANPFDATLLLHCRLVEDCHESAY
jgi:hypothetical protein